MNLPEILDLNILPLVRSTHRVIGKAEKAVQITKRLFKKAKEEGSDPYVALLNYRAAPLAGDKSPAEICMHRRLRTKLPSVSRHMKTFRVDQSEKQKKYYDKGTKVLEPLNKYDTVRIQKNGSWQEKAQVQKQVAPNSYQVQTESGSSFRRNRRHLLRTQEEFHPESPEEMELDGLMNTEVALTGNVQPGGQMESPGHNNKLDNNLGISKEPVQSPIKQVTQSPIKQVTRSGRLIRKPSRFVQ